MHNIILASKSPYRKELLQRLNINFNCIPSKVNEDNLKSQISDPTKLTLELARQKAKKVAKENPESLVIGSDQVCVHNNEILGKTGNKQLSKEELRRLQGTNHSLFTSYVILYKNRVLEHTNTTNLKMKILSEDQISRYVELDNPVDCAGSYKLESYGIGLFEAIETSDHTAIIGLPLLQLSKDLISLGVSVP